MATRKSRGKEILKKGLTCARKLPLHTILLCVLVVCYLSLKGSTPSNLAEGIRKVEEPLFELLKISLSAPSTHIASTSLSVLGSAHNGSLDSFLTVNTSSLAKNDTANYE